MCGIVGVVSGFTNGFSTKEADVFYQMLYMDAMRGWDSTGVFGVDKLGNVQCHKEATEAAFFLNSTEYKDFRSKLLSRGVFAVGHNRAATRGSITDKNAHPFWVDDKVVLVQNGTYKGSHKHHKDVEVDTEAIAHVLADEENIEKALTTVNAAYALVWYDTRTKSLHLIRNEERPLYLAKTINNGLLFCSEPGFLYLAASRNDLELVAKPEMLAPETLVSLKLDGKHWERTDQELSCKYVAPPIVHKQEPPFRRYCNWPYNGDDLDEDSTLALPAPRNNVVPIRSSSEKSQVDHTLSELLLAKYDEYHMNRHTAAGKAAAISVHHDRNVGKEYPIQLMEYEAANSHPDCTTWHVWGIFANLQNLFGEKIVAHWFIYNKTEVEALEYVGKEWYTAKIQAIRTHYMNDNTGVVSCFMTDVDYFNLTEAEPNAQIH